MSIFFIASNGHCATSWFAEMLSRHPSVQCWHGRTEHLKSVTSAAELARVLVSNDTNQPGAIGCVHLFPFHALDSVREDITAHGGKCAFMIRNPITRVNSQFLTKKKKGKLRNDEYDQFIASAYGQDSHPFIDYQDDSDFLLFGSLVVKCLLNDSLNLLAKTDDLCIQFETVTKSPEVFSDAFTYLTDGKIKLTDEYLSDVDLGEVINKQTDYVKRTEQTAYDSWPASFQEFFRTVLEFYPDTSMKYRELTYLGSMP